MKFSSPVLITKLFAIILILIGFFFAQNITLAAVAHDAVSESHGGATGSTNQSSFSWTHTPGGTPRGVLVFVHTVSATKIVTSVTYGGVAMTEIVGGATADTANEVGRIDTFFLGISIPTGTQAVVVNRTNNGTEMYASASTQTASGDTEIYTPGIVLLQENGSYTAQSVTDGSTGVDSLRYASGYYGGNNPLSADTGSTVLNSIDYGSFTSTTARETTAGQGARNVGFTGSVDDRAGVHLAVREAPVVPTVTTPTVTSITASGATLGANVTSLGVPASISARGTCWGTSPSPVTNCVAEGGTSTGVFTHARTGMTANTLYYYRGFATNSTGTGYSTDGTFTTAVTPITTIGTGTNPSDATIAPGASVTDLDTFTLNTNTGSDTVSAITVSLSPTSSYNNIAQVDITDNSNQARCTAVINPLSSSISFTTCSSNGGISVTTSTVTYKVRITPKTHANMPTVPGASYATTGTVTSFTSTNTHSGSDTASATITIDNLSPTDVSSASGSAGNAQTTTMWTNPTDTDFQETIVLRRAGSAVVSTPTEGVTYLNSDTVGTATVACTVSSPTATCNDTGLTNGTTYHYKIFTKDTHGNYSTPGVVPTGSPFTPSVTTFTITASSGSNGSVTPSGVTNVAQGGSQAYSITPDSGYDVSTLTIDGSPVATSTSYTFTNVQANHTISATFIASTVTTYTITSSAGANGSISPLGATVVNQGANQSYTITPDSGYNIDTLTVDSVSIATSTSYTFTNVQADHTIAATFIAVVVPPGSFTITATAGAGGTIVPSGATVVTQGSSQTFAINANSGYEIATLVIDSVSVATSTSYTFTDVQTNHTIATTFVAIPGVAPVILGSGPILASITFDGKAFPRGSISVVHKKLDTEITDGQQDISNPTGSFHVRFADLPKSIHTFGLLIKDPEGRATQTKFYTIDANVTDAVFENIVAPPTIDVLNRQVTRGKNAKIVGYASPSHTIRLYIDGILYEQKLAGNTGTYAFDVLTGPLEFGQHKLQAKQINLDGGTESDFSTTATLTVSNLSVVKADFNTDGKVDISDWSIFLSRWGSKTSLTRLGIDLNDDGFVDIKDFSIFIRTIRK